MEKSKRVELFFNNTGRYLNDNQIITLRANILRSYLGEIKQKKIIDIGCGNGTLTLDYINNNEITFVDLSEKMLEEVKRQISGNDLKNAKFIKGDFTRVDMEEKFDIIIFMGVVAHLEDIDSAFKKLSFLLKNDGILILQFTNCNHLISKFNFAKSKLLKKYDYAYKLNKTSLFEIEGRLKIAGFKKIKTLKYFPISPFFSLVPSKNKLHYLTKAHRNKVLSKLGSEVIFVMGKAPDKSDHN